MMVLVQAVFYFYFVSVELEKKLKLNILLKKIFEKAKRFFEIPEFKQYAIADGIYRILLVSAQEFSPMDHHDEMRASSYSLLRFSSLKILAKIQGVSS